MTTTQDARPEIEGAPAPAATPPSSAPAIRTADLADIPALVAVETAAFAGDRISRRSFRRLLTRGHQTTLVAERPDGDGLAGYAMVLFHRGTSLARLYSFAVAPDLRGRGIARALLAAAEAAALAAGAAYLRLEVRADNARAIRFYEAAGYRRFGVHPAYYDDAADALRLEKALAPPHPPAALAVPYVAQSLAFTCGPACLMMAMRTADPAAPADEVEELRIWRESTTIFMTRGPGGCSPYGLALAAHRRGFDVSVHVHAPDAMFVDTVRAPHKKRIVRLVQADYRQQCAAAGIPVHERPLTLDELAAALDAGAAPVVLVSTYALDRERTPHWVVVAGLDERFAYVHDPFVDADAHQSQTDRMLLPIPRADFARMTRYGRAKQRAALIVRPRAGAA